MNLTPLKFGTDFIASRYCQSTGSHAARTTVRARGKSPAAHLRTCQRLPLPSKHRMGGPLHRPQHGSTCNPAIAKRKARRRQNGFRSNAFVHKGMPLCEGLGRRGRLLRTLRRQPGYLAYQEAPRWKQLGRPPVEPGTRIPHGRKRTWPRRITKLAHSRRASFACRASAMASATGQAPT